MNREYKPQAYKPASNYVVDLASLSPGEMQIEALNFECRLTAGTPGLVAFQSPTVAAQPGFYFVMTQIVAGVSLPMSEEMMAYIHLMEFNILNQGRNKSVFKNNINMATMINAMGVNTPMVWGPHVGFRFFDRADVQAQWFPDLTSVPGDIRFYLKLMGFNVRGLLLTEEARREYEG
jgi:hypothetical protein